VSSASADGVASAHSLSLPVHAFARALGETEGAFLLWGLMLALAYHQQGDRVSAFRWFERNRAAAGSPGLFAEEFDTDQRQLRGNLPQTFVHALMLETAVTLR
jgi:GH15 family glucan-1,4-alpha-glucosidase